MHLTSKLIDTLQITSSFLDTNPIQI